jgi:hypothetical protein
MKASYCNIDAIIGHPHPALEIQSCARGKHPSTDVLPLYRQVHILVIQEYSFHLVFQSNMRSCSCMRLPKLSMQIARPNGKCNSTPHRCGACCRSKGACVGTSAPHFRGTCLTRILGRHARPLGRRVFLRKVVGAMQSTRSQSQKVGLVDNQISYMLSKLLRIELGHVQRALASSMYVFNCRPSC